MHVIPQKKPKKPVDPYDLNPNDLMKPPAFKIGHVVVSVFVFYAVVVLFGARGLHRWTQKLPVGDVATEVRKLTETFWGRTAGLGLEKPSLWVENVWLRFQEAHPLLYPHEFDVAMDRQARAAARKALAAKKKGTLEDLPLRAKLRPAGGGPSVLVLGDSIIASIGPSIRNDIISRLAGDAEVIAKVATGLARPDVFDWRRELRRYVEGQRYDMIVMMLGTNDSQDFVEEGQILVYGTEAWVKAYNKRIDELMAVACKGADRAVWLGLPPMKSDVFQRKAVRINSWAQRAAERHSCVQYVSLDRVVGDEKGKFTSYRKMSEGLEKVRMVDGIHITAKGGSLVAKLLVDMFRSVRGVSSGAR